MTVYTIQLCDGSWPEHVGETLFHGELPCIGHELYVHLNADYDTDKLPYLCKHRFRVVSVDHHATLQSTGTYATKVVVVVERAK